MGNGTLFIVSTPLGNLKDITLRALEILGEVDIIAAEDTRQTRKLLSHFSISCRLISYHDHVENTKADVLVGYLKEGKDIALVSDGGTPLICDPGYNLLQKVLAEDIEVFGVPGPTAGINALVLSGMPVDRFVFEGYFSRSPSKRRKKMRLLIDEERTMVFYESPHRLLKALKDILLIFSNRRIAIMREMTKKFEEHFRGTVAEAIEHFEKKGVKGEFVLVLEGRDKV